MTKEKIYRGDRPLKAEERRYRDNRRKSGDSGKGAQRGQNRQRR